MQVIGIQDAMPAGVVQQNANNGCGFADAVMIKVEIQNDRVFGPVMNNAAIRLACFDHEKIRISRKRNCGIIDSPKLLYPAAADEVRMHAEALHEKGQHTGCG